jgi:hypothetical protein
MPTETAGQFAPPDRFLLARQSTLLVWRFDPASGAVIGDPESVAQGVGSDRGTVLNWPAALKN